MLLVAAAETALRTREAWRLHGALVWSNRDVRPMMRHCSSWVSTSLSTLTVCLQSWRRTWRRGLEWEPPNLMKQNRSSTSRACLVRRKNTRSEAIYLNWPALADPERSLLWPSSPFQLEGTLAGTDISPKQQGARGLCRTIYPTNTHINQSHTLK